MKTEYAVFYQMPGAWTLLGSYATRQEAARKAMDLSNTFSVRLCSVDLESGNVQVLSTFQLA